MLGLVGAAISVGCARSANLRSSAGNLPDLAPTGTLEPAAVGSPARPDSPSALNSTTRAAVPGRGTVAATPSSVSGVTPTPLPAGPAPVGGLVPDDGSEAANGPLPGAGSTEPQPPAPGEGVPPAPPLRDSELRRAQAVTRQHFESLGAVEASTPTPTPILEAGDPNPATIAESSAAASPLGGPNPDPAPESIPPAPLPPLAASARVSIDPGPAELARQVNLPPLTPIDPATSRDVPPALDSPTPAVSSDANSPAPAASLFGPAAPEAIGPAPSSASAPSKRAPTAPALSPGPARSSGSAGTPALAPATAPSDEDPAKPDAASPDAAGPEPDAGIPAASDDRPAAPSRQPGSTPVVPEPTPAAEPSLEIAELKLCSRVTAFGAVAPIHADQVETGRLVLVYCEMAGLEYQRRGESFVSRLAAHIELQSESTGRVVWEESPGTAEDVCPNRRRDYYVSYRVRLPRTLEPGRYRLRLIQTDMIGNRVASRELPITLVRRGSAR